MNISFYMPFKPFGHPNPSGDLVTGSEIHDHLNTSGHNCRVMSDLRCRWIYLHPELWPKILWERHRIVKQCAEFAPRIWLSYHSYYKAPDLLGPYCSRKLGIPYALFQGIYSTKRKRKIKTLPGYFLNRTALKSAEIVFTNKQRDKRNLQRILPNNRICYIPPGINTNRFCFDGQARQRLRTRWGIENETVILAAAMFRPGVKTLGLQTVISSCAKLLKIGRNIRLVIVGDGSCRDMLEKDAVKMLPDATLFTGLIPRNQLAEFYSAADIFAFPGIQESLGMVYLEAQACGLPVIAYGDWGGGEVVVDGETGLLSPASLPNRFTENLDRLVRERDLRKKLAGQAASHIRLHHELKNGYTLLESKLTELATMPENGTQKHS